MAENGYEGDLDVINYDRSKQVAVLFSRKEDLAAAPREMAEKLAQLWDRLYERTESFAASGLSNLTVLSGHLQSYGQLSPAFERISRLSSLSFFMREVKVLEEQEGRSSGISGDFSHALELLGDWEQGLFAKRSGAMREALEELFTGFLKGTMDWELCRRVTEELRERLLYFNEVFDHVMEDRIRTVLSLDTYAYIEELSEAACRLSEEFMTGLPDHIHSLSQLSRDAISYIHKNYSQNIGLTELADSLNMAPAYVSRVFNREVGMGIPAYLTRIRMEKARQLLADTGLRVSEIARMVGVENVRYFNVLFKKHMMISPQEYRNLEKDL